MFRVLFAFNPARKPNFHGLNPLRNCPDDLAQKVAHQEKTTICAIWAFLSQWVCLPESRYPGTQFFWFIIIYPIEGTVSDIPCLDKPKNIMLFLIYIVFLCIYMIYLPQFPHAPVLLFFNLITTGKNMVLPLTVRSLESGFEWCPNPLRVTGKYMGVLLDLMGNYNWQLACVGRVAGNNCINSGLWWF